MGVSLKTQAQGTVRLQFAVPRPVGSQDRCVSLRFMNSSWGKTSTHQFCALRSRCQGWELGQI